MTKNIEEKFADLLGATEVRKVDYKRDQYLLDNEPLKSRFIKDIVCMANAPGEDGYIILGVKSEKGKPPEVVGITNHHDSSSLESIVNGIIEEPIQFEYYPLVYKGKECALLHIPISKSRPHWPKKNFGVLKKHIFYTRRASANTEASFAEIREMFLSSIRVSEAAQRKVKLSRHVVDELADMSLDDRKLAMYRMLKSITSEANLGEYRSIMSNFLNRRKQEFALVRGASKNVIHEFAVFMYPWNAKGDSITWSRRKIQDFLAGSRTMRVAPPLRTRLKQSSLIHVSYKRIYTTSLEKWPYSPTGYWFANEWTEPWGKAIKWEDSVPQLDGDKMSYIKKAKYEFFLPNVASKAELKERLEQLLLWVDSNIT